MILRAYRESHEIIAQVAFLTLMTMGFRSAKAEPARTAPARTEENFMVEYEIKKNNDNDNNARENQ